MNILNLAFRYLQTWVIQERCLVQGYSFTSNTICIAGHKTDGFLSMFKFKSKPKLTEAASGKTYTAKSMIGGNYKRPKSKFAVWSIGVVLRG